MMKIGAMSLNVRNTTATAFAQIVYDLGYDMIELHSSAFESTDIDYLRDGQKRPDEEGVATRIYRNQQRFWMSD